jgi:hypothetical protein
MRSCGFVTRAMAGYPQAPKKVCDELRRPILDFFGAVDNPLPRILLPYIVHLVYKI